MSLVVEPTAILIAAIVATGSVCSPILLSLLNGRQRRQERLEDYARQDAVAAKAAEAAALLKAEQAATTAKVDAAAVQAQEAARLLKIEQITTAAKADTAIDLMAESNRAAAERTKIQNAKLDQIHSLVNSNLTEALESELDAHKTLLAVLLVLAAKEDGNAEALVRIDATRAKIAELQAKLSDRLNVTKQAAARLLIDESKEVDGGIAK